MTRLNCESLESACNSLAELVGLPSSALVSKVANYPVDQLESDCGLRFSDVAELVWGNVIGKGSRPVPESVVWFHGTRVVNGEDFREGLLPLDMRLNCLESLVVSLAEVAGVVPVSESGAETCHFSANGAIQVDTKTGNKRHWGPFAFLTRDAIVERGPTTFDYTAVPEIVFDIAQSRYGRQFDRVLEAYRNVTRPCIVHFVDYQPRVDVAAVALLYCYNGIHANGRLGEAHTCYNGQGVAVDKDRILRVEYLD